jgi:hypothetical protein
MVTATVMNARTRTRFYSLPFISNYVRDENNNVYCTSTRALVGKWSNTHGVIEIDGDYYHGPAVESSQNQHSVEIEFTPEPPSTTPSPRNSATNLSEYFQMDYYENEPTMEPLELSDLMPEEGEIVELYPIEGASHFRYSNYGHIVMSSATELTDETITTVGYGDMIPITIAGRVYASLLMLGGVLIVGATTATVISYLSEKVQTAHRRVQEHTSHLNETQHDDNHPQP